MVYFFRDGGAQARRALVNACNETAVNVPAAWALTRSQRACAEQWACPHCDGTKVLGSKQAQSVHMARMHGVRVDIRRWVSSSVCVICMVGVGTRPRCIAHLAYRPALCRLNTLMAIDPLADDAVLELDLADALAAGLLVLVVGRTLPPWRAGE